MGSLTRGEQAIFDALKRAEGAAVPESELVAAIGASSTPASFRTMLYFLRRKLPSDMAISNLRDRRYRLVAASDLPENLRGPSAPPKGGPVTGPNALRVAIGGNRRAHGGGRTRFVGTGHHGSLEKASLPATHPAVVEGRTLFRGSVVDAGRAPRVLVAGFNNAKIGAKVEKGPWTGMPIFTLTLEERATCPRTCEVWAACMGNAMHMARRHRAGAELEACIETEVREHARRGPFAVRLHVLGDFYSEAYVLRWAGWLSRFPQLHIWGYTARLPSTEIGGAIVSTMRAFPDRFRMRFSVAGGSAIEANQVATIWRQPDAALQPEGRVCPQSMEKTATCGTCGLCWAKDFERERILFVGHGMSVIKRTAPALHLLGAAPAEASAGAK